MFDREVFAYAKNIYEININFYKKFNINTIFIDLDNTLDSYKNKFPCKKAIELIKKLSNNGIEPIIVSNNSKKRVERYTNQLGIKYIYRCGKPFAKKFIKYLKKYNFDKNNCLFIGDQLLTDIGLANKAGIKGILTSKLCTDDQLVTKFNKNIESKIMKKMIKNNKLKDWSELYGEN